MSGEAGRCYRRRAPRADAGRPKRRPSTLMPIEGVESEGRRPGDGLWSAWLVGVVLAALLQRLAFSRMPLLEWVERALLPLVRSR